MKKRIVFSFTLLFLCFYYCYYTVKNLWSFFNLFLVGCFFVPTCLFSIQQTLFVLKFLHDPLKLILQRLKEQEFPIQWGPSFFQSSFSITRVIIKKIDIMNLKKLTTTTTTTKHKIHIILNLKGVLLAQNLVQIEQIDYVIYLCLHECI